MMLIPLWACGGMGCLVVYQTLLSTSPSIQEPVCLCSPLTGPDSSVGHLQHAKSGTGSHVETETQMAVWTRAGC